MLDTRQAPPFSVPLRFFLTAPLFGVAGAALLFFFGAEALATRWSPVTLAVLHCFTAGLMLQGMLGSLFQVLPVAAGCVVPRARIVAAIVHPATAIGAILLCCGFIFPGRYLLSLGGSLLALGCGVFILSALSGLVRTQARNPVRLLLRTAITGLAITVALGLSLAFQMEHGASAAFATLFNLHALWGFAGWALPLVAAVASLVVPMFYMSPKYPETRMHRIAWLAIAALVGTSAAALIGLETGAIAAMAIVALSALAFGLLTLDIFRRRKRPRSDASCHGWRSAMCFLALAVAFLFVRLSFPNDTIAPLIELAVGICLALGTFAGLIGAMQLKILPFLSILHLSPLGLWQLEGEPGERPQKLQVTLQTLSVAALLVALFFPSLVRIAALILLGAQLSFASNVWRLAFAFRRTVRGAVGKQGRVGG